MKSLWDETDRLEILKRSESVAESARPLWGRMSAPGMLAHLSQSLKMAVGELPTKSKRLPLRYFPLKQLVVYAIPFPKNAPTAPELLEASDQPFATSRQEIRRLIPGFVANAGKPWPEHPAFGKLNERAWGVLVYRHMDHHLRQFGA